jgi:hypothetical protein
VEEAKRLLALAVASGEILDKGRSYDLPASPF